MMHGVPLNYILAFLLSLIREVYIVAFKLAAFTQIVPVLGPY